jgi:hypothetical protein
MQCTHERPALQGPPEDFVGEDSCYDPDTSAIAEEVADTWAIVQEFRERRRQRLQEGGAR